MRVARQVKSFGKILPEQPVRVLVGVLTQQNLHDPGRWDGGHRSQVWEEGRSSGNRGSSHPYGITEDEGLVICVDGENISMSKEHGKIHAIYDPLEQMAALD